MISATKEKRSHISKWTLRICFVAQVASLAILTAFNFCDERLEAVSLASIFSFNVAEHLSQYRLLMPVLGYLLALALSVSAAGMILAESDQRNLKHLFLLTTMIAMTLAIATNWQRISWEGRRWRMSARVESLIPVCESLQRDWPKDDADHPLLGPIMAYPQWNPSTLLLLTPKPIDDRFKIAAVDRSSNQVLRFELSSGFETIWLEYRDDNGLDDEFTNGISQRFVRERYISLGPSWYLVRYH